MTFFDIVIDFIFFDAFDDLENPPSSVTTVVQNRWLSNGFKETVSISYQPDTRRQGLNLTISTKDSGHQFVGRLHYLMISRLVVKH